MILFTILLFSSFAGAVLFIISFIYHKLALFFLFKQFKKMKPSSSMEKTTICGQSINEEVIMLREELRKRKEQNERLRQRLHEDDKAVSLYQGLTDEGETEISRLQNEILRYNQKIQTDKNHKKKLADAKRNYNDLKEMYSNQIRVITEKIDLTRKIQKEKINKEEKKEEISINKFEDSDSDKNKYLMENDELIEKTLSNDKIIKDNVSVIDELEEKKSQLDCLVEELKKNLDVMQCQLQKDNDGLKELTEEVALLESQLEAQKSQPLPESSRGNSVFCEFDEKKNSLIQKTKQLEKAHHELKITLAETARKLKYLMIEDAEELKEMRNKNLQKLPTCDNSDLSTIKNLEEELNGLIVDINETIYKIYPNLKGSNAHYMSYKITKPLKDFNSAFKELNECSSYMHTLAEELYDKQIKLLGIQEALLIEEEEEYHLTAQIQEYMRAESIKNDVQPSCSSISSVETKQNETDHTNSLTESENVVEASKPDKEKKRAPIKFICKQIKINMSDFD